MLSEHGSPGGRLTSLACTDATARRVQYRAADDEHSARELAKAFVDGKVANMRVSLLRASRRVPDPAVTSAAETLAITRLVLGDATSYDQILGHEGTASREYFRAWRQIIGGAWDFTARERRPPPDPVNAMLSFGYTMLAQEAIAALETAGLDSAVGFLYRGRWEGHAWHWI
jgi:CRISPR-associated protein Cas1